MHKASVITVSVHGQLRNNYLPLPSSSYYYFLIKKKGFLKRETRQELLNCFSLPITVQLLSTCRMFLVVCIFSSFNKILALMKCPTFFFILSSLMIDESLLPMYCGRDYCFLMYFTRLYGHLIPGKKKGIEKFT